MPTIDFAVLRRRISMEQVLTLLAFEPTSQLGQRVRGPCPLHESPRAGSRDFSAHLGKCRYRCFRCGAAGNQLDLWAAAQRIDTHPAAIDLCRRLGIDIPWR